MKKINLCLAFAALLAIIPVYVGLKHNPMGEFCLDGDLDKCKLDLPYVFKLWLSWFIVISIIQIVVVLFVKLTRVVAHKFIKR